MTQSLWQLRFLQWNTEQRQRTGCHPALSNYSCVIVFKTALLHTQSRKWEDTPSRFSVGLLSLDRNDLEWLWGGVPLPIGLGREMCPIPNFFDFFFWKWWVLVHSGWRFHAVCYLELLHKGVRQKRKEEKEPWWRTTFCTDRWTMDRMMQYIYRLTSLVPPGRLTENTKTTKQTNTSKTESFAVSSVQNGTNESNNSLRNLYTVCRLK